MTVPRILAIITVKNAASEPPKTARIHSITPAAQYTVNTSILVFTIVKSDFMFFATRVNNFFINILFITALSFICAQKLV